VKNSKKLELSVKAVKRQGRDAKLATEEVKENGKSDSVYYSKASTLIKEINQNRFLLCTVI
jgi:hypothetical protein